MGKSSQNWWGRGWQRWGVVCLLAATLSLACPSCVPFLPKRGEGGTLSKTLWSGDDQMSRQWGQIEQARVRGELEQLRDQYMNTWAVNPYDPMVHVLVGRTMEKSNDAFPLYQAALELDPENYWALVGMGEVYLEMGMISRSVETLNTAIQLNPDQAQGYLALGLAQTADGDHGAALDTLLRAVQLDPGCFWIRKSLGETLVALDRQNAALEHLEAAAPYFPEDWSLHLVVATMQEKDGELEDALESYKKVKELRDVSIDAHMGVVRLGMKLGLDDGVEDSLGKVLQMQPWNGEAKQMLADIYVGNGNCRGAMRLLRDLIDEDPAHVSNRSAYARCLETGDKIEEAMLEWFEVVRLAPQAPEPRKALEKIVTGTGAVMEPVRGRNLQQVFDRNLEAISRCYTLYKEGQASAGAGSGTETGAGAQEGQREEGDQPGVDLLLRVSVDGGGFASSVRVVEDNLGSSSVRLCALWQVMNAEYPQGNTLLIDFPIGFD